MFFASLLLCDHVGLSAMAMVVLHAGYIGSLDGNNENAILQLNMENILYMYVYLSNN